MLERVRTMNAAPLRPEREFVLVWSIAARRTRFSFTLDRALALAKELDKPIVVLEPLRAGYRWASDRIQRFMIEAMRDNAARFAAAGIAHYPYVEPRAGAGRGLLEALASRAAAVIAPDSPAFFLPRMVRAAAPRIDARFELVDDNGIVPIRAPDRAFSTARAFRYFFQRRLRELLAVTPAPDPLRRSSRPPARLPRAITERWPRADVEALLDRDGLARLPIDHTVAPVPFSGGEVAARKTLSRFVKERLARYAEDRNHPDSKASSELSPYLHFGHLSAHEIFAALAKRDGWTIARAGVAKPDGKRGAFGMSAESEAFLDELVTWRELSYGFCFYRRDYDRYSALPAWARATLAKHARDPRPERYSLAALEAARTGDPVWNAAQRELVVDGRIGSYLRMLWGKKILEWSPSPQAALATMRALMDRWSLDGRNPNSYAGYAWTLGRYDRPWPERPIFGKVRSMSSERTAKKLRRRHVLRGSM